MELGPALTKPEDLGTSRAGRPAVLLERLDKEAAEWPGEREDRAGRGGGGGLPLSKDGAGCV